MVASNNSDNTIEIGATDGSETGSRFEMRNTGKGDLTAVFEDVDFVKVGYCITFLLGSKERYQHYFDTHRGVYWYSAGWIENNQQPGRERYEQTLRDYVEKYGQDNAEYLMQMEQGWIHEYQWATYVDWGFPGSEENKRFTRRCAEFLGWDYDELEGDPSLVQRLVDGQWDEESFLLLEPGQKVEAHVASPDIIRAT